MSNGWTPERRRKQAELISRWKPWEQSTGPKTNEGKSTVASNAWRGGYREQLRALSKMVNEELRHARELVSSCNT
jgi:hypothetical protein